MCAVHNVLGVVYRDVLVGECLIVSLEEHEASSCYASEYTRES
jgi:hypothetical protein